MREIKDMLTEWAAYFVDNYKVNGYPKQSAFVNERVQDNNRSTESYVDRDLPADAKAVDAEIAAMSPPHRAIIREHYTKRGSMREHAKNLKLNAATYCTVLRFIHDHLAHKLNAKNT